MIHSKLEKSDYGTPSQQSNFSITEQTDIQDLLGLFSNVHWIYDGKQLKNGYFFPITTTCYFYNNHLNKTLTITMMTHQQAYYVQIQGEQDYGIYRLSTKEGQKIADFIDSLSLSS